MKKSRIGIACAAAAVAAGGLLLGGHDSRASEGEVAQNHINVIIERVADDFIPGGPFAILFDVDLSDETGVTAVSLRVNDVLAAELVSTEKGRWGAELAYADVPAIVAAYDGVWAIEIDGSSPSATEFTLDIEDLVDADLFEVPTVLNPVSAQTGVANDVVFEWINPAGEARVDILNVEASDDHGNQEQDDNNIFGGMSVEDTQWDPPLDLIDGLNEFAILYVDVDATRASSMTVTKGSIAWGGSPFAPAGYPANTPLFGLGSERILMFVVGAVCPADIDGSGSVDFGDVLALLFAWGPCDGCAADLNGDGNVAFDDLLDLLFAWGEVCP